MNDDAFMRLLAQVRSVKEDPALCGVLSTGEQLAVAIVLNRADWLAEWNYTLTDAIRRVGPDWLAALPRMADGTPIALVIPTAPA